MPRMLLPALGLLATLAVVFVVTAALAPAPVVEEMAPSEPLLLPGEPALASDLPAPPAAAPVGPPFVPPQPLLATVGDGQSAAPPNTTAQATPQVAAAALQERQAPPPVGPAAGPTSVPPVAARSEESPCDRQGAPPVPGQGNPPGAQGFSSFRAPLPLTPRWNPPGPKRVGLQAGHWLNEQTPPELGRLQHGSSGGGKAEWEVNLDIAQRAQRLLEAEGFEVDVLPTTVPPRYRAHVFVSVHADGDVAGQLHGYKIARPGFSSVPEVDDRLVEELYAAYGQATALPRDDEHITLRMRYYYAFNSRRYCHAVAPGVPQAIVETGFLTSAQDRVLLLGNPGAAARGIANGITAFLAK